jgi:uncharacterized RDD family membrane protein YckC
MSIIRVTTSFNLDIDFEAAPFHKRLFAWSVDLFILIFYLIMMSKIVGSVTRNMDRDVDYNYNMMGILWLMWVPFFIYHPVCEILMNGQSIGKKLMGIRIVNENGGKPGISQFIIRWLIRTGDYTLIIFLFFILTSMTSPAAVPSLMKNYFFMLGGAGALFVADIILVNTKKQQRLGDLLAHTILIKTKQKTSIDDTIFLHVAEGYTPSFPQVMQLSDRDINALKSILDAAKKHHDYNLAFNASEKIKSHLHIETSLSPFDFLEILLKDYNALAVQ